MNLLFDTVIVGCGLAGACSAFELAGRERVLIVDQSEPGAGASGTSIGLISPLMARRARPVWRMPEAVLAFDRLMAASGAEHLVSRQGVLKPAASSEQAVEFRDAAQRWPDHGAWYDSDVAGSRWPDVRAEFGLLAVKSGGSVSMPNLCRHLVNKAEHRGAHVRFGTRLTGWRETREEVRVQLDGESETEIRARRLLIAIGAGYLHFDELARLKLHPIKGQWIRLSAGIEAPTIPPVSSRRYVAPDADDFIVGSTYEHDYRDDGPTTAAARGLQADAADLVPRLRDARLVDVSAAIRVTVPGIRLPMIGPLPGRQRVWIFTGLGSKGLLMAPMLSAQLPEFFTQPKDIPKQIRVT